MLPGPWGATLAAAMAAMAAMVTTTSAAEDAGARIVSTPYRLSPHVAPGETFAGIRLLGSVALAPASMDGLILGGLSGVAWDADEGRLYALSDRGALFHLRPGFEGERLVRVELLAAHRLRDARGQPLAGARADAEDLVAQRADNGKRGDTLLTVAFERHPRVLQFTPEGRYRAELPLPDGLDDPHRYAAPNKSLEALVWLPGIGFVAGPERPLAGEGDGAVTLFSLDGRNRWSYPLLETPNASLVALERLPDGRVVALERGHGLMYVPIVIALRRTRLAHETHDGPLAVETLAVMDSSLGWSVDNFEGLARYRGRRLFLVSDDNFNELQRTLLVHLEILPGADTYRRGNLQDFELRQKTQN